MGPVTREHRSSSSRWPVSSEGTGLPPLGSWVAVQAHTHSGSPGRPAFGLASHLARRCTAWICPQASVAGCEGLWSSGQAQRRRCAIQARRRSSRSLGRTHLLSRRGPDTWTAAGPPPHTSDASGTPSRSVPALDPCGARSDLHPLCTASPSNSGLGSAESRCPKHPAPPVGQPSNRVLT